MTLKEIACLIDIALAVARKDFRNDTETIDRVESELKDAFGLWGDQR